MLLLVTGHAFMVRSFLSEPVNSCCVFMFIVDLVGSGRRTSTQEKNLSLVTFLVMALCCVQKCDVSYSVRGMTQNCISPSEIIIPNRECVIRHGIGEDAYVIFKQVSHTIR